MILTSVVGVVILLGGLIFFHELGHYTVAKLFGVKVEVFSLGFGYKLFRRKFGDTEYCLSVFPLGGYVKLMGDDPYKSVPAEDAERAFSTQKLYKRFFIVAAGPISNLLLAYVLFAAVFFVGQPTASTRIGTVQVNSPAWAAGIRPKDRIVAIDDKKILTWNELEDEISPRMGQKVELVIQRGAAELRIPYTVGQVHARNPYGEEEVVGGIKGIQPSPLDPQIGISDPASLAFKAGLRSDDVITKIGSREILVYDDINEALTAFWKEGEPLTISVKRGKATAEQSFPIALPAQPPGDKYSPFGLAQVLGIYPSELFVEKLSPDSPAEKGGLKEGDRIVSVGGIPIYNFESIVDQVQEQGAKGETVTFIIERNGKPTELNLKPFQSEEKDPITLQPHTKYLVGFRPDAAYHEPEQATITIREPIKLISKAFSETNLLAKRMLVSIFKLVAGKISAKNLGGPVLIAKVAGQSLDAGLVPFLQAMAAISINLFLLNLFPIPILDGGHLLFFILEALKGKPVSIRTMEIANQVGMVFILGLVVLTLFNDVSRIIH